MSSGTKIYVGSVCVLVPVIAWSFSPTGRSQTNDYHDIVYRNLSWNTTDESLRQVSPAFEHFCC